MLFDIQVTEIEGPELLGSTGDSDRTGWALVRVVGELDVATAPRLRQEAVRLVSEDVRRIVLDLGGVDFIDSTGLGVIVGMVKRLRTHGGDLALVGGDSRVRKVFEITRVSDILPLHDTVDDARASLQPVKG